MVGRVSKSPVILWFRDDLRLSDHEALTAALKDDAPILAIYVLDEATPGVRPLGGASRWWLHHALVSLSKDLKARGGRLDILRGPQESLITQLATAANASAIHWSRRISQPERDIDAALKSKLKEAGIQAVSHDGLLLHRPWDLTTKTGGPFRVYTPFWRALQGQVAIPQPLPAPKAIPAADWPKGAPARIALDDLGLLPTKPDWAGGLRDEWQPGEAGAKARLEAFLDGPVRTYADERDRPDKPSTSKLSPHLRFGEISPRQVWHAAKHAAARRPEQDKSLGKFLSEVAWREFAYHLLFHNPELARKNYNPRFDTFPWKHPRPQDVVAWQRGQTGYPIVDAGLRELWTTGFMHNRVRMIVASFLIKHMMVDWRTGEDWFWDTLCDADPANNAASWQWVAGSGADAAPYFRIFNPILQGEKFDPNGDYVRRFVPELARMPKSDIHAPWQAPPQMLIAAGVKLGDTYPEPIVDHPKARERALAAFAELNGTAVSA